MVSLSLNLEIPSSSYSEPSSPLRTSSLGVPRDSLPSTSSPSYTLLTTLVPTMAGNNPKPNQAQIKTQLALHYMLGLNLLDLTKLINYRIQRKVT
jgi:hypothetical protein